MKCTWTGPRGARFDNKTYWPLPEQHGDPDAHDTCAHELRYPHSENERGDGVVSSTARYHGADVIRAYELLVEMPLSKSRVVLKALKQAVKERGL